MYMNAHKSRDVKINDTSKHTGDGGVNSRTCQGCGVPREVTGTMLVGGAARTRG